LALGCSRDSEVFDKNWLLLLQCFERCKPVRPVIGG
jgi:hypothetical protein